MMLVPRVRVAGRREEEEAVSTRCDERVLELGLPDHEIDLIEPAFTP